MRADAIQLAPGDDVATVLRDLAAGAPVRVHGKLGAPVTAAEAIPAFHKIALAALPAGAAVAKDGTVIGEMVAPVAAGGLVHVHNLKSLRARANTDETR